MPNIKSLKEKWEEIYKDKLWLQVEGGMSLEDDGVWNWIDQEIITPYEKQLNKKTKRLEEWYEAEMSFIRHACEAYSIHDKRFKIVKEHIDNLLEIQKSELEKQLEQVEREGKRLIMPASDLDRVVKSIENLMETVKRKYGLSQNTQTK